MLFAAFVGAFVFGRFADVIGRKRVYWMLFQSCGATPGQPRPE
jgi:MFS family permease